MSAGRQRSSLADWSARRAAERPAPASLDRLPDDGAMLAPHRSLRAAAERPRPTGRTTR